MTKSGYKPTELGELPEEWEVVRLGDNDVCELVGGGTPSTVVKEYWGGDIPFVIPTDVTNLRNNFLEKTENYITETGLKNSSAKLLSVGTVLLTSRATIGFCAINKVPVTTNQGFASLICKDKIHNLYLLYFMKFIKNKLNALASGSTFKEISKTSLRNLKLPCPPLPEQRKIASILSTVDESIQKTDALIIKTQELKKGLMQELLTKGIGHKKFKKTEVGEISEEWDVVRLGDIVEKVKQIDPRKNPNKRFRYVDVSGISNEFFKIIDYKEYVGKDAPHRARKHIKEHDIIFATVRPYLKRVAIVPTEFNNEICSTAFTIIRCVHGIVDYMFVFHYLLMDRVIGTLTEIQRGSNYPAVSDSDVHNLKLPLPPLPEQQKIASILSTVDEKIEIERNRKQKLQELKKGLMQVLLTGKVRVKVS